MMKKAISLFLCLIVLLSALAGCSKEVDENDKGAYITMYLTDMVYDFDPAHAYGNESALRIVSLLYNNLFVLDENGKVKKSLAKDYKISEDDNAEEYKMIITLNDTKWSDTQPISAEDVVYAWKRILDVSNSFDAAVLLYDIKNARAAKAGECSIDDVRIYALNEKQIEINFEGKIDYDQFLLNLTSYALVPLRETVVKQAEKEDDWAKSSAQIVASGPFRLRKVNYEPESAGLILERNSYYYRDIAKDAYDKSVTPYRLIVDYTMTDEEIKQAYNDGKLFYVGDIPLSLRGEWKDVAEVKDALSTHIYSLNQNAVVRYYNASTFETLSSNKSVYNSSLVAGEDGDKIFAIKEVRQALSLAIDRDAIANEIVFADAASGLIPNSVFNTSSKKETFRKAGSSLLASGADISAAKQKLSDAGVDASKYMFAISVPAYDEVHVKIAEMVKASWEELGFHVAVNAIDVIDNQHKLLTTNETLAGVKDDVFAEDYRAGRYEVAGADLVANSVDAFSVLAPFAKNFTGRAAATEQSIDFVVPTHITGYDSEDYNSLIEKIFDEKNIKSRTSMLHEAEEMLMDDMPVIPVIFNKTATMTSKELSKVKYTYYGTPVFTKTKLKDYQDYVPAETE